MQIQILNLEYEEGMRTYRTTEKGMRLLQIQNTMDEIAPD
jgi:predicted transcriptional regulator